MPVHARSLDQTHDRHRSFPAAQRPGKQPVRPPKRPLPDQVLCLVVVDEHSTIFQVAHQRYPAFEPVIFNGYIQFNAGRSIQPPASRLLGYGYWLCFDANGLKGTGRLLASW